MAIGFLLVGCGRIGMRHAEIISKQGRLIAVCDTDPSRACIAGDDFEAAQFMEYDKMLHAYPDADVVAICTPNGLHASQTVMALQHGFHVICEKPMALTVADCEIMIAAANAAAKKIFIVKQNRFNPPVVAVKKILEENRLGNILSFQLSCFWNRDAAYYQNSWKGTLAMDGGTLFTQFSHFIDLLYWMLGDVEAVQAFTKNSNHKGIIEFEDTGVVMMELSNGAIGTINYTVNAYKENMEGSLTIFGEKGTVKIGGQYLNELEYQQIEDYTIPVLEKGNGANNYGAYKGSMSNHAEVYKQVIASLQNSNDHIATNSFEALKAVEIIERIYTAAKSISKLAG